jgi:SRSO17 transposase
MAAIIAPARVAAEHLSLLHLVGQAAWSDAAVLGTVRDLVRPAIERQAAIAAWIVDDTGFAKKGVHSVGVAPILRASRQARQLPDRGEPVGCPCSR